MPNRVSEPPVDILRREIPLYIETSKTTPILRLVADHALCKPPHDAAGQILLRALRTFRERLEDRPPHEVDHLVAMAVLAFVDAEQGAYMPDIFETLEAAMSMAHKDLVLARGEAVARECTTYADFHLRMFLAYRWSDREMPLTTTQ